MKPTTKIPHGAWPLRLTAAYAAAYVGEASVPEFLRRVESGEYPQPRVDDGRGRSRRRLWLRSDLEAAVTGEAAEIEVV